MAYNESALDAIYEDVISGSDAEEGEIEDGEYAHLHPMDVDRVDATGVICGGEIIAEDDYGETLESVYGNCDIRSGNIQMNNDSAGGQTGPACRRSERKRSKKRRSGKRKTVDVARFVRETCVHLQEKKISLIWALVKNLGVDAVSGLVNEVDVIEKCGGQMTNDKKRRRTPGGVLWNILRGRVQPEVYKEIMSQGQAVLKQKTKEANETLKRQRMDVDEPANKKRRRVVKKDADTPMAGADGKQVTWPTPCNKVPKDLGTLTDGPVRDDSLLPTTLVQKAWVEGLRKKDDLNEVGTDTSSVLKTAEVLERSCESINSAEKAANVVDRLRMPVQYSDLQTGEHDEDSSGEPHESKDSSR